MKKTINKKIIKMNHGLNG